MVGIRFPVVANDGVDHGFRHLRAARAIEEGHRLAVEGLSEGGKPGSDRVDVEGWHVAEDASGRLRR